MGIHVSAVGLEETGADWFDRLMGAGPQTARDGKLAGQEFHTHALEPVNTAPDIGAQELDKG
ncbi:hypothetical protein SDC9_132645 [bioreactor metagenome]|uniref:Uncharacterized protein n=1 Tax=bioreactor metagenome TaxID=1076179 RepID=A0A645D891_9ZZZZ